MPIKGALLGEEWVLLGRTICMHSKEIVLNGKLSTRPPLTVFRGTYTTVSMHVPQF
jgi:hypothetical protein